MAQYEKKRYSVYDVTPGMEVGDVVLTEDGKVALGEGTVLNFSLIERLKYWGVPSVVIREAVKVTTTDHNKQQQKQFADMYQTSLTTVKQAFQNMRYFKEVPLQEMVHVVYTAVDPLVETAGVVYRLHKVPRQDEYTFHHSVNVAVIAGVLGKWLGYDGDDIKEIVLAGLLHDIGKTQVPLSILNKPGKLTDEEMEIMRSHTTAGYNLLKDNSDVPRSVMMAVLQHHERMDGSGYPMKVQGNKIHPFARIIAVADIYDAMTSDKVYHEKASPFTVVEMLVQEMFNKLDPSICTSFLNNVRDYFVGSIVKLSDGQQAEVVYLGQVAASRPIVRTEHGDFIDLEKRKDIGIVSWITA